MASNRNDNFRKAGPGRRHQQGAVKTIKGEVVRNEDGAIVRRSNRGLHVRSNWKYEHRHTHALTLMVTERNLRAIEARKAKRA